MGKKLECVSKVLVGCERDSERVSRKCVLICVKAT